MRPFASASPVLAENPSASTELPTTAISGTGDGVALRAIAIVSSMRPASEFGSRNRRYHPEPKTASSPIPYSRTPAHTAQTAVRSAVNFSGAVAVMARSEGDSPSWLPGFSPVYTQKWKFMRPARELRGLTEPSKGGPASSHGKPMRQNPVSTSPEGWPRLCCKSARVTLRLGKRTDDRRSLNLGWSP